MLSKFLDPKNDVAFKKIFGTEKNKDILIRFLNDMLTFKEGGHIQEEGRAEGQKAALLKVAQSLFKQGLDVNSIQQITGLSKEDMESLK